MSASGSHQRRLLAYSVEKRGSSRALYVDKKSTSQIAPGSPISHAGRGKAPPATSLKAEVGSFSTELAGFSQGVQAKEVLGYTSGHPFLWSDRRAATSQAVAAQTQPSGDHIM